MGRALGAGESVASDLLRGAKAIAEFWFVEPTEQDVRSIYYLAEHSKMPIFRMGSMLCARRSTLLKWIQEQEQRGWKFRDPPLRSPSQPASEQGADEDDPRDQQP